MASVPSYRVRYEKQPRRNAYTSAGAALPVAKLAGPYGMALAWSTD